MVELTVESSITTYRSSSEFYQRLSRLKRMAPRVEGTTSDVKERLKEALRSDDGPAIDAAVQAWLSERKKGAN